MADVQTSRLKAVAVVTVRLENSRSPEQDSSGDFLFGDNEMLHKIATFFRDLKQKTDFKYFQKLANEGDADGQFNFGNIFVSGQLGYIDHDQAEVWWKKSAEQGHQDAQHNLFILRKMRNYYDAKSSEVAMPTLTEDGITLGTFSTAELLEDIRAWQENIERERDTK